MTLRRIIPYILIIVQFDILYFLTMVIDNDTIYTCMGYQPTFFESHWNELTWNNKFPLQQVIFTFGITLVILLVNLFEIISTKKDKFIFRLIKSALVISITYFSAGLIQSMLDLKLLNIFYKYDDSPAEWLIYVALTLTGIGIIFLEVIKSFYLINNDKSKLKLLPTWLKMEINSI